MGIANSFNTAARNQSNDNGQMPATLRRNKNGGDDAPPAKRTIKALDVSKIARARKNISAPDASKIKRGDNNDNNKK